MASQVYRVESSIGKALADAWDKRDSGESKGDESWDGAASEMWGAEHQLLNVDILGNIHGAMPDGLHVAAPFPSKSLKIPQNPSKSLNDADLVASITVSPSLPSNATDTVDVLLRVSEPVIAPILSAPALLAAVPKLAVFPALPDVDPIDGLELAHVVNCFGKYVGVGVRAVKAFQKLEYLGCYRTARSVTVDKRNVNHPWIWQVPAATRGVHVVGAAHRKYLVEGVEAGPRDLLRFLDEGLSRRNVVARVQEKTMWFQAVKDISPGEWVLTTYVTGTGKDPFSRLWPVEAHGKSVSLLSKVVVSEPILRAFVRSQYSAECKKMEKDLTPGDLWPFIFDYFAVEYRRIMRREAEAALERSRRPKAIGPTAPKIGQDKSLKGQASGSSAAEDEDDDDDADADTAGDEEDDDYDAAGADDDDGDDDDGDDDDDDDVEDDVGTKVAVTGTAKQRKASARSRSDSKGSLKGSLSLGKIPSNSSKSLKNKFVPIVKRSEKKEFATDQTSAGDSLWSWECDPNTFKYLAGAHEVKAPREFVEPVRPGHLVLNSGGRAKDCTVVDVWSESAMRMFTWGTDARTDFKGAVNDLRIVRSTGSVNVSCGAQPTFNNRRVADRLMPLAARYRQKGKTLTRFTDCAGLLLFTRSAVRVRWSRPGVFPGDADVMCSGGEPASAGAEKKSAGRKRKRDMSVDEGDEDATDLGRARKQIEELRKVVADQGAQILHLREEAATQSRHRLAAQNEVARLRNALNEKAASAEAVRGELQRASTAHHQLAAAMAQLEAKERQLEYVTATKDQQMHAAVEDARKWSETAVAQSGRQMREIKSLKDALAKLQEESKVLTQRLFESQDRAIKLALAAQPAMAAPSAAPVLPVADLQVQSILDPGSVQHRPRSESQPGVRLAAWVPPPVAYGTAIRGASIATTQRLSSGTVTLPQDDTAEKSL